MLLYQVESIKKQNFRLVALRLLYHLRCGPRFVV
jgi:hypothetical protein